MKRNLPASLALQELGHVPGVLHRLAAHKREVVVKRARRPKPNANVTIEQILDQPMVTAILKKLEREGFPRYVLEDALVTFANARAERLAIVPGMTKKRIQSLLGRIMDLADTIEHLNQNTLTDPRFVTFPLREWRGRLLAPVYLELPDTLRMYAVHLSSCMNWLPLSLRRSDRQAATLILLAMTEHFTKRLHYARISELLTAALHAAGEERDITAPALLQLAKDHRSEMDKINGMLTSNPPPPRSPSS
jgi:hypothetical protein